MAVSVAPVVGTGSRSVLYRLGHRLLTAPQGPTLELALESVARVTGFERVLLLAAGPQEFELMASRGLGRADEHLGRYPLTAALLEQAMQTRELCWVVPGRPLAGLDTTRELRAMDASAALAVPLVDDSGEIAGERRRDQGDSPQLIVYLETTVARPAPELSERLRVADTARQALTAVVASRLFAEVVSDRSSGAYVRGHFDKMLAEEVHWAREAGRPLTLIVMALVAGPGVGQRERSLARAAEVVRASLREGDLLGRFGPDELAVLLPGASHEQAQAVVRRLTARLAAASLAAYVGAASVPEHADSARLLLSRADAAVSASVLSGRPQVWSPALPPESERSQRLAGLLTGEVAQDYRRLQLLFDTTRGLLEAADTRELLRTALRAVLAQTGADRAMVLCDEGSGLGLELGLDKAGEELPPDTRFSRGISRQVLRSGRAVCLRDTTAQRVGEREQTLSLRSVMCVPLWTGERLLGVIYVDSISAAHDLVERDLALFELFASHVAVALARARAAEQLREDNARLVRSQRAAPELAGIVAESPTMRELLLRIDELASDSAPVSIVGECGTGKQLLARLLHARSERSSGPLVVQSCAASPPEELERELFGHVPGAFNGATRLEKGLLESAKGGTLVLTQIEALDRLLQAKLLRVIEDQGLRRLGDSRLIATDLKLIVTAGKPLQQLAAEGRLQTGLGYRLSAASIELPPLRQRREDIPPLAEQCLARNPVDGARVRLSPRALEALLRHDWPGNVRELREVLERAIGLCGGGLVEPRHLGLETASPQQGGGFNGSLRDNLDALERRMLVQALEANAGNVTHAARTLGVARQQLQRLLKKHQLARR